MKRLLPLMSVAGLVACSPPPKQPEPVAAITPPAPVATLNELMLGVMVPAYNRLSDIPDSIGDPATAKPTPEKLAADWAEVRRSALALAEIPHILAAPGRTVVAPGAKLQNEGVPGNLPAAEIQARIHANFPAFVERAKGVQAAALVVRDATDKRDLNALLESSAKVEAACEACHEMFWYPGAPTGKEPAPAK